MKPPRQRDVEGFGLARHCAGFSMPGGEKRKKPAFLQAFLFLDHQWIILIPVLGQSLSPRLC